MVAMDSSAESRSRNPGLNQAQLLPNLGLRRKLSAALRDQLLRDMENLNSAQDAAVWARRILPAKNTLHEADARQVEEAFEAKLTAINGQSDNASVSDGHDVPQASLTDGDLPPAKLKLQQVRQRRPSTRADLPIPSRVALGIGII